MSPPSLALLDTDTLSELLKPRGNPSVKQRGAVYLALHGFFLFSIITSYEILKGLKAKQATRQINEFELVCQQHQVLSLTDQVIKHAADIYAELRKQGQIIADTDILIAATAITNDLELVTGNIRHFANITALKLSTWHN